MAENIDINFPTWGLLPKKETGVTQFLTKYPEYDGRGTIIAVLDSGVDPGAPGLQVTSNGKTKIIERINCTGSGDVDTSKVVKTTDGYITGLTGRKLKIPATWANPTGEFHIGVKNAYSLYPKKLKERIESTKKKNHWDEHQKNALIEATRQLAEFEAKHPEITTTEEKLEHEELESRVEFLTNLEKKYEDLGPTYDCVVFHDGEMWRCGIDTSEKGDLESGIFLGEYSITKEFAPLSEEDQLNTSINVHENGNLLEIVALCSAHGTHVACIAAGNFPDNPELNGVAPGAQIISLCIGDTRLNTMESGAAVMRAMIYIMNYKQKIHAINMSYGERAHWSNAGRIGEVMNEVIDKYGVVWMASAGNMGPALCTVNTPPDINSNSIISVGAYVSPDMMMAEYSLREKMPGMPFTWSSRGPMMDGGAGITVCAPGAAITSVPSYTLRKCQLLNGTSMSAPHVTGAVAILISGLLAKGINYSPFSIKRALENTALFISSLDAFAQGSGLLQVEKAFDNLINNANATERDVKFTINCGPNNAKGILLRAGVIDRPKDYAITVEPIFMNEDKIDPSRKINFNLRLSMVCDAPWVHCPTHFDLMYMSRAFAIRIDAAGLAEGAYTSNIRAYDVTNIEKGPVFHIPVTVIQPSTLPKTPLPDLSFTNVCFKPNTIQRHFIYVPEDATWAVLKLRSAEKDKTGRFVVHTMQLKPRLASKTLEINKMLNITPQSESVQGFPVQGGLVLEVAIAKYWANIGDIAVDYCIEFHGIRLIGGDLIMQSGDGIHRLEVRSSLRNEEVVPNVTLKYSVQVLRPIESKISPLRVRDVIPPARQIFELVCTYTFHIAKTTEITPNAALLSEMLYENEYESQLWIIYNCNKQQICCGDAFPNNYTLSKIEKGDYTLKIQIRHEKKELLEKISDMPLLLNQKLSSPINLDVYASHNQAIIGGKKMVAASIPPGHILPLYIAPLTNESKISRGATLGSYLQGSITFCKDEIGKKIDCHAFKFVLSEPAKKNANQVNNKADKEKLTKWDEYTEALRDLKCTWLSKLEPGEHATTLYGELRSAFPDHLPIHTAMLTSLDSTEASKHVPQEELCDASLNFADQIISIADAILNSVDQDKLLAYYGLKTDKRPDAIKIKQTMDKQRTCLVEALVKKGCALARLYVHGKKKNVSEENTKALLDNVNAIWRDVQKFAEATDSKVLILSLWHAHINKYHGRYLKLLKRYYEDRPVREVDERIAEESKALGWEHYAQNVSTSIPTKYPPEYALF